MVTRLIRWPGGELYLNIAARDASKAEVSVRVSDAARDPLDGFDHVDCEPLSANAIRQRVTWKGGKSISELEGQLIRLEIFLQCADLFTFVAD